MMPNVPPPEPITIEGVKITSNQYMQLCELLDDIKKIREDIEHWSLPGCRKNDILVMVGGLPYQLKDYEEKVHKIFREMTKTATIK